MPEEYPELLEILSLHLASGIGWRLYQKLETAFGSARAVLSAPQSRLESIPGIGPTRSAAILAQRDLEQARREIEKAQREQVTILHYYHPEYPALLQQTGDPPLVLYVKGTLLPADSNGLSIVGTRKCSLYGRDTARKFARQLAQEGRTIVSGMARGIDTAAHTGALEGGGRTVAVLGSGLLKIYPQENTELYEQIAAQGAVVSEFPLEMPAAAENFPRRNRIIAWLTRASLIVEGDEKSGSMITARYANEEGRTVLALPGRIDTPLTRGPHSLIRDGATIVRDLEDIREVLSTPFLPTPGTAARQRLRSEAEQQAETPPTLQAARAGVDDSVETERRAGAPAAKPALRAAGERVDDSVATERRPPKPVKAARPAAAAAAGTAKLPATHQQIVAAIPEHDPISFEGLLQATGLPPGELSAALIVLEVKRQIKRLPGPTYERGAR